MRFLIFTKTMGFLKSLMTYVPASVGIEHLSSTTDNARGFLLPPSLNTVSPSEATSLLLFSLRVSPWLWPLPQSDSSICISASYPLCLVHTHPPGGASPRYAAVPSIAPPHSQRPVKLCYCPLRPSPSTSSSQLPQALLQCKPSLPSLSPEQELPEPISRPVYGSLVFKKWSCWMAKIWLSAWSLNTGPKVKRNSQSHLNYGMIWMLSVNSQKRNSSGKP